MNARRVMRFLGTAATAGAQRVGTAARSAVGMVHKPRERREDAVAVIQARHRPTGPPGDTDQPEAIVLDAVDAAREQYLADLDAALDQMRRDFGLRAARIIEQMEETNGN